MSSICKSFFLGGAGLHKQSDGTNWLCKVHGKAGETCGRCTEPTQATPGNIRSQLQIKLFFFLILGLSRGNKKELAAGA